MEAPAAATHDRTRYEGRNLLVLLLALFGPAFVLFLGIAIGIAERANGLTTQKAAWLHRASYAAVVVFVLMELVCARYTQRLLPQARTRLTDAGQYAGMLLLCLFVSYCGAVACEAFGYAVFLRVAQR